MSTSIATRPGYTPEDLLNMPDSKSYELVNGQLVERKTGTESSWVGGQLFAQLDRFCKEHNIGWVFPADSGYQCFPHDPRGVRRPDLSVIRFGRLPGGVLPKGWSKITPDLAVEVLSPNDSIYELAHVPRYST
jgi:Uma2 family endonuclease